jgi:hypothetical protein
MVVASMWPKTALPPGADPSFRSNASRALLVHSMSKVPSHKRIEPWPCNCVFFNIIVLKSRHNKGTSHSTDHPNHPNTTICILCFHLIPNN